MLPQAAARISFFRTVTGCRPVGHLGACGGLKTPEGLNPDFPWAASSREVLFDALRVSYTELGTLAKSYHFCRF